MKFRAELERRYVFRVAVVYAATAFAVLSRCMLVAVAGNHAPLATARRLQLHMERAP